MERKTIKNLINQLHNIYWILYAVKQKSKKNQLSYWKIFLGKGKFNW